MVDFQTVSVVQPVIGRDGRRYQPSAIPHHGIEMVSSTRPACGDRLEPVPLMDHHHRPLLNGWRQSNTRRGDGHQEPLDRRGNHPPRGRAPSAARREGEIDQTGPARTGADRPARTSGCCSSAPSLALYSKRITFQHTFPLPRESRPRTKPTKGTARKPREAKPKGETEKPLTPKPLSQQRPKKDRREYDQKRNQLPERREQHRLLAQDKRRKALALGLCRNCKNPSIPDQTRCPTC